MESSGLWMLAAAAVLMLLTGLPAWVVLAGVALAFSAFGAMAGAFDAGLLAALYSRLVGLLENDLLQALPLYVLMGALINRLPLADILFRAGTRALAWTGCGRPLAGLGLGVLLAPMSGSVGASASMLTRTVYPRLDANAGAERNLALVCTASTLGVVIPPSLVLILLGDAMLRAHTEAANVTGLAGRIINTQDVFHAALIPAAIFVAASALLAWVAYRGNATQASESAAPLRAAEWATAVAAVAFIVALLAGVALGYLYAVEAAAAGGVALAAYGFATRTLDRIVLRSALDDTLAITGALFALLVAATFFTLVQRGFGTDRWLAAAFASFSGAPGLLLAGVLAALALCAFVLDAFEMIFVVIPLLIPPLLTRVTDATWVAVLTLLILQASFLVPPFGYAVLMARSRVTERVSTVALARALWPYVAAQAVVLVLVLAFPNLLWREAPPAAIKASPQSEEKARELFEQQLEQNEKEGQK